jgi:hypothetical protein
MSPTPNEFSRIDFSRGPVSRDASEPEASQFGPYPGPDLVPTEGEPKQWQVSSDKRVPRKRWHQKRMTVNRPLPHCRNF